FFTIPIDSASGGNMYKKFIIGFLLSIAMVGAIPWLCQNYSFHSLKNDFSQEEDQKIPLQDRMDLAMRQEIEITKDPATNTVPRERLIVAKNYADQLRRQLSNQRMMGAIAGVNWVERG